MFSENFQPKNKVHKYHTEKNITLRCDKSFLCAIALIGVFFVLGMYFSH
jgi:hypothetical protein